MLTGRLRWAPIMWNAWPSVLLYTLLSIAAVVTYIPLHHPHWWGVDPVMAQWLLDTLAVTGEGVPFGAIAALGTALAIFLGFRNNSAYDRWWEARKIWGALVNDSRSWARQCVAWVNLDAAPEGTDAEAARALRDELVRRQIAFVWGLGMHLRRQPGLLDRIEPFLPDGERELYEDVPNVISALLVQQGRRVAEGRRLGLVEHFRHLYMDQLLTRMSDIQGKCERIKNTPVPRQYDEIPRLFVTVYAIILPFGMVGTMGWVTVPVSVTIATLFMLLEGSGRVIEDPFENRVMDTPMTALSRTIERDLLAAIEDGNIPPPIGGDRHGVVM